MEQLRPIIKTEYSRVKGEQLDEEILQLEGPKEIKMKKNLLKFLNQDDDDFQSDESMKGINYNDIKSDRTLSSEREVEEFSEKKRDINIQA